MSPKIKRFTKNSVIYFTGDVDKNIYILKSGKVVLNFIPPDSFKEESIFIKQGEFFGLKSAMGNYPREETAICLTDVETIVLKENEFINLISNNTELLFKILKILSKELRETAKKVNDLLGGDPISQEEGMLEYGNYYFNEAKYKKALYFYKKFLEIFPDSEYVDEVKNKIEQIKRIISGEEVSVSSSDIEEVSTAVSTQDNEEVKLYYEGMNYFSQGKYNEAIDVYKKLLELENLSDEYKVKSYYEIGRCFYNLGEYDKSVALYKKILKEFEDVDILKELLLELSKAYIKLNKESKAIKFLKKVIDLPPQDTVTTQAKKILASIKNNQ